MTRLVISTLALAAIVAMPAVSFAAGLFGTNATAIGIDLDGAVPNSSYPGTEGPINLTDQVPAAKYLNFGAAGTGAIITPGAGATTIQSIQFTTANDAPERDPLSYEISGTNDAITSGDNSLGDQENWTLIATGMTGLDTDPGRLTAGSIQDFANGASFTSYRIFFPTLRDEGAANSMQLGDLALYTGPGGGGTQILQGIFSGDSALAVTQTSTPDSSFPGGEAPHHALDMDSSTKYLNFGEENSGLIVARRNNPTIVDSLTFTTANDAPERDPLTWALYGTDDPLSSTDNSDGDVENWTLVDSGVTGLEPFAANDASGRFQTGETQAVNNSTPYMSYRITFPSVRDAGIANSMQVADIVFGGTVIPEPSTMLLTLIGLVACGRRRQR